jgi:hypothetical protein
MEHESDINNPFKEFNDFGEFEYINEDKSPWMQIRINFKTEKDFIHFMQLTGLKLTQKTKATYFPQKIRGNRKTIYEKPQ